VRREVRTVSVRRELSRKKDHIPRGSHHLTGARGERGEGGDHKR
jgi:hypothetical protein